jgi:hypothetical protein
MAESRRLRHGAGGGGVGGGGWEAEEEEEEAVRRENECQDARKQRGGGSGALTGSGVELLLDTGAVPVLLREVDSQRGSRPSSSCRSRRSPRCDRSSAPRPRA